jgi:two-component system NtrC family sensor kinase
MAGPMGAPYRRGMELPAELILAALAVLTTLLLVARQTILLRERNATVAELRETHLQAETALRVNRELTELLQQRIVEMEGMQGQLVQASRQAAVGGLASALAHEVNNPLTGVLGYAELLLSDLPPEGQGREELETIRSEALRARRIVRSLVDFARPRPPEQAPADVNDITRVTVDLIRYHVERGGVSIQESYADLPVMTVDRAAISQLLLTLLNNAVQAMPDGGTLRVTTRTEAGDLAVSIADDGGGMDEATLGRIFEPFFTTRKLDAGHGLGLPVALGIAEAHGGTIDVASQPGGGTIAELRLPLSLAAAASTEEGIAVA